MAVDADPANRKLMESTTPARSEARMSTIAWEADAED